MTVWYYSVAAIWNTLYRINNFGNIDVVDLKERSSRVCHDSTLCNINNIGLPYIGYAERYFYKVYISCLNHKSLMIVCV